MLMAKIPEESLKSLLESASKAAEAILKCVDEGGLIHVSSHFDADGLAAAGIIGKALTRLEASFQIRIHPWIDEKMVDELASEKPDLTIFTDLGSGYLDLLSESLSDKKVIILDHHQPVGEPPQSFLQVNPHTHGIDGTIDLSGAGVTYLVAKNLDQTNMDLAYIAVVGSLGDLQDKYSQHSLGGVNEIIVEDAVKTGYLEVSKDLIFFGRETRPIHKALACTTSPFIPGISGEEDKSLAFLTALGIKLKKNDNWRALRDLSEEEKTKLCSELANYLISKGFTSEALNLIGHVYTFVKEENWTPLRDGREFSVLLNATGRMERPSLGVAICMGDRGSALEEAEEILREYRRTITKHLTWLTEHDQIQELENIYLVRGENQVEEKIIGTVASVLSTSLPKLEKPVIAYAIVPGEGLAKVSSRATEMLMKKGMDLGEIMRVAAEKFSGRGGGHNIAAGAQVPIEHLEEFLRLVDKLVRKQLEEGAS